MILNTDEIHRRIFGAVDERQKISVTPAPDESAFRKEGGASIDLHLGRWFRTMRQSNIPVLEIGKDKIDSGFSKEHFVPFEKKFRNYHL
jgi:hypothetical protein